MVVMRASEHVLAILTPQSARLHTLGFHLRTAGRSERQWISISALTHRVGCLDDSAKVTLPSVVIESR